jgi:hypothetical protein
MNKPAKLLIFVSLYFIGLAAVAADAPSSTSTLTKPISTPSFIDEPCHDYLCVKHGQTSSETSSPVATTDVGNPVPGPKPTVRPATSIRIDSSRGSLAR